MQKPYNLYHFLKIQKLRKKSVDLDQIAQESRAMEPMPRTHGGKCVELFRLRNITRIQSEKLVARMRQLESELGIAPSRFDDWIDEMIAGWRVS